MDGELLLESQLTGDPQWPHCVRGFDLDFLPLSSPRVASPGSDWPRVRSATVGGPALHTKQWTPSRDVRLVQSPEETQGRQMGQGAHAPQKSFPPLTVQHSGYGLESAVRSGSKLVMGSLDTIFTQRTFQIF